ncbi:unnamed protein product, partial [Closterium sp. NIES-54]
MEIARTSIIHARGPHFLWPYTVRYAGHQLNLWPRVSRPEVSSIWLSNGSLGVTSDFRVWRCLAHVCDTSSRLAPSPVSSLVSRILFCYIPHSLPQSLTTSSHPITNYYRTAHLVVSRVLPSLVTDITASPSSVSALVATYYDFAATRRLDYATRMVASPPLSTRSESAIGCDILEDKQFELEFLAAVSPHLCAVLLAPEGDPHAFDMPTPRTYRESSIAEAVISANAMAAQELRRLTFLLTDLGERPRSAPPLFADNKAMILLCREPRLEGRVEHNVVMYFLLRELQRHGQTNLDFVASAANTTDIFTKALLPDDHHRFCLHLGLVQVGPRLLYAFGGVSSMRAGAVKGPAIGVVVGVAYGAGGVVSAVADVVSAATDVVSACRIVANALVLSASGMV